jgi:uridine kinase
VREERGASDVLRDMLDAIRRAERPDGMPTRIVAVDGHGGAGKSSLSEWLSRELDASVIHTDDFASWENPTNWWPEVIERVLEPIRRGATSLSHHRSSFGTDHHPEPVTHLPVTRIMILEGVTALRKEFRPYLAYGIWVDTPREICLQRGIERGGENTRKQWEQWMADEDRYIERERPGEHANLVLPGDRSLWTARKAADNC